MANIDDLENRVSGCEARLASLDVASSYNTNRLQNAEGKTDNFTARIATLEERINHMPTKEFIVKTVIGSLTILGLIITFQDRLRARLRMGLRGF